MYQGVLVFAVLVLGYQESSAWESSDGPITVTPYGSFRGSWMETRRGRRFEAYRGIRYAEPPVGELRFQPPKLILNYSATINATEDGPSCPRPDPDADEDCLIINVYTPRSNSSKLFPVIFYIHAGGFHSLSGRSDMAGPHYLLEHDLVFVAINYRLATLGYFSTGEEFAPGNNGFKDQVVALRWLQRYIQSFGGDPNLVTISGGSSGSRSAMLLMISPMAKGLFHRAIGISGSPTIPTGNPTELRRLAIRQAELVNCPTNSTRAIFDCLKAKPWKEIGDSLLGFREFADDPVTIWQAVIEPDFGQERFLTMQATDAIMQNKIYAVPFMAGVVSGEFFFRAYTTFYNETLLCMMDEDWDKIATISFQTPRNNATIAHRLKQAYIGSSQVVNDTETLKSMGTLYRDSVAGFPVHRMVNLMARYSPEPVYYYHFTYRGKHSHFLHPVTEEPVDVAHIDDLIYLFTMSYKFPTIPLDSPDSMMIDKMTAMWYNFAKYGDPNPRSETPELGNMFWPAMNPTTRQYLHIDSEFSVQEKMFEDRMAVWEELFPLDDPYVH